MVIKSSAVFGNVFLYTIKQLMFVKKLFSKSGFHIFTFYSIISLTTQNTHGAMISMFNDLYNSTETQKYLSKVILT